MTRTTKKKTTKKRATKKTPARRKAPASRASRATASAGGRSALVDACASAAGAVGRAAVRVTGTVAGWVGAHAGRGIVSLVRSRDVQRVLAMGVLAGGLGLASHGVRSTVEAWPQFAVHQDALRVDGLPEGLSERVREDVTRLPLPRPANAFDRRLVPFTAALLGDLQWVERVDQVRLVPPRGLQWAVTPRRPVARVGTQVLTKDGALIDSSYAAQPTLLPKIRGLRARADLLAIKRAVEATLSVLDDLGALAGRVSEIDLTNLGRVGLESEVCLLLDSGTRVDWGRPSCSSRSQLPGETKRAALEEFLENGPDLAGVERVSVRWDETSYVLKAAGDLAARR